MATYDKLFKLIDTDQGGTLSIDEVTNFCEVLPNAPQQPIVARLFAQADTDKSGSIDEMEFSALCEGIKMLVNMTEAEMVDAYAVSEIKRLFTYLCTANGKTMRRDELRKALDILTDALQIRCADMTINAILREHNASEVDFDLFRHIIEKLCPEKSLTNIATVFVEEETRRKEKLSKTRSVFEMKKPKEETEVRPARSDGPCVDCEALKNQLQAANEMIAESDALRLRLNEKILETQEFAMKEVEQQTATKRVQAHADALQEQVDELLEKLGERDTENSAVDVRLRGLQKALTEAEVEKQALRNELDQTTRLEEECEQLREEMVQLKHRNARREEEVEEERAKVANLERRLRDKDAEAERMGQLMNDLEGKEEESIRMERLMAEMKKRCNEREEEAARQMMQATTMLDKVVSRENALEEREDKLNEKYRALKRYEDELHFEWDGVIERARKEQEEVADKLAVQELEMVQREAELKVREQLIDNNIRKAEQTSLPERERRLKLLQHIEKELCEREKQLRQAEAGYLQSLVHPELDAVRAERDDLKQRLWSSKAELENQTKRHAQEIEKLINDHNARLNSHLLDIRSASANTKKGRVRSSTLTATLNTFGSPESPKFDL